MQKPQYFIIFPTFLLTEISHSECILSGLLASLAKSEGYAYAGNQMLADTLNVSTETIQRYLLNLEKKGFIKREQTDYGRKIMVTSKMIGGNLNSETPPTSKLTPTPPQNCGTDINNTINKSDSKKDKLYNEEFLWVWNDYGKRGAKYTSAAAYSRLSALDRKKVAEHIPVYVQNHKDADKLEFLPHLSTYLNQRRWEDELPYQSGDQQRSEQEFVNWD